MIPSVLSRAAFIAKLASPAATRAPATTALAATLIGAPATTALAATLIGALAITALAATLTGALAGCASAPAEPIVDRLDADTATTVTVVAQPVQLVTETPRNVNGDPFAYIAPFETDRAGDRSLYLWISAPQNSGPIDAPKLMCDGRVLSLQSIPSDLAALKLARAPYVVPAPWSSQWYYVLPRESLECLGAAQGVALETTALKGDPERFTASGKALTPLKAFANHSTNQ
jgi:hypothetical protein